MKKLFFCSLFLFQFGMAENNVTVDNNYTVKNAKNIAILAEAHEIPIGELIKSSL